MRKLCIVFALSVIVSFFCACNQQSQQEPDIQTNFTASADVQVDNSKVKCEVSRTEQGMAYVKINEPQALSGLTFSWNGNDYGMEYSGLSCKTDTSFLPDSSFPAAIINAINVAANKENLKFVSSKDKVSLFEGDCKSGKFKIEVNKDNGVIKSIIIDDLKLNVKFLDEN